MAYNRKNYLKQVEYIMHVYRNVKEPDIPDTRIVANIFPKHNIYISYSTWKNIKGMRPSEYSSKQLMLF
ncbi:hypothetical protein [Sphingobacterium thalpophilum]|uniref:hypothetical protein n=1 Tax=Sphingobacterium thalpophilum TaxID=259 RepID=UPI0024A7924B|nr:hypothetical protein [Sphingobacterium thalpophilum]